MKRASIFVFITGAILTLLFSCKSLYYNLSNQNFSSIYDPVQNNFDLRYKAVFLNDSSLRVFFSLNASKLLYIKESGDTSFTARFSIMFKASDSYDSRVKPDTSSIFIKIDENQKHENLSFFHDLPLKSEKKHLLIVSCTDLNKGNSQVALQEIDNLNLAQEDFYITTYNQINYSDYLEQNTKFILHSEISKSQVVAVKYYQNEFQYAIPPFAQNRDRNYKLLPDSTFKISITEGKSSEILLSKPGIYVFGPSSEKSSRTYTLFVTDAAFPGLIYAGQMLEPMRYLTSRQEYEKISSQANLKKAIDEFWISISGSPERAREMIRKYFSRVMEANLMFTSFYEGWKTDRGMIYIIFGPPNTLYRDEKGETWIYGEPGNMFSVTMNFLKTPNPFSNNEYTLIRSSTYKESWYNAVDIWRR